MHSFPRFFIHPEPRDGARGTALAATAAAAAAAVVGSIAASRGTRHEAELRTANYLVEKWGTGIAGNTFPFPYTTPLFPLFPYSPIPTPPQI